MRLLFVSDVYFPRVNGVSTSIQTFRAALDRAGHQVRLIAPAYGRGEAEEGWILRMPSRRVPFDPEDRLMSRSAVARLRWDGERPELVHIQTPFAAHSAGLRLARRLRAPVVETYHTYFEEYLGHYIPFVPDAWLRRLARRLVRAQCRQLDALVVPSHAMASHLRACGVGGRVEVIPTGLALAEFQGGDGARFRARHGIPPGRPVLVHVGRVAFEKNLEFVLRAVARVREEVPDVLLVVAGEGPALPRLRRLAEELGLGESVLFVSYLDRRTELLDCYRSGDAFVFASRTETQGLVLLEAMALGVPVVSTAVLGTKDLLAAGRGALVPPEDEAAFAAAIVRLLRDPELRRRLGEEGRALARDWSAERQAERLADLYRELVEEAAA